MASEQVSQNELFAQAIAEVTRVAIPTMSTAGIRRQENPVTKMDGTILKQPMFNWKAKGKYGELQNIIFK